MEDINYQISERNSAFLDACIFFKKFITIITIITIQTLTKEANYEKIFKKCYGGLLSKIV